MLAKQGEFDIALISNGALPEASIAETYPSFRGHLVNLADDLAQAREQIAALELDTLIYMDIGMEPMSYFLAFARLARVQCVMGGHPITTGIGALDYFMSSDLIEVDHAQNHYSEILVRQPFGSFHFSRPGPTARANTHMHTHT